ncbi:MAG: hypothetical protein L0215_23085, partial [Gemmataceae bacterium]|nr:hypothetical protein [Gemmataceae bacterium]
MIARRALCWAAVLSSLFAFVNGARAQEKHTPVAQAPMAALKGLRVYPEAVTLDGPRDEQRLGVVGDYADGRSWDLARSAKFTSSDATVAAVDAHGVIRPLKDGQTLVTVAAAGLSKTIAVKVTKTSLDIPVSFTREVQPILTKAGCNQGACHGAQHGRGGFKLSLLGFDASFDHAQIVQSAEGRRVVVSDAERSIFLQKPALLMEHGGGERFKAGGREWSHFKRWLEDGAPEPSPNDSEVTRLEVWPTHRIMVPGEQQQILVKATRKDGRSEDVTATAQFDTLNDGVASVAPSGLVTAKNRGETHIMVRYCGQATVFQVTLPYAKLDSMP